jgi:hypothetical protein
MRSRWVVERRAGDKSARRAPGRSPALDGYGDEALPPDESALQERERLAWNPLGALGATREWPISLSLSLSNPSCTCRDPGPCYSAPLWR